MQQNQQDAQCSFEKHYTGMLSSAFRRNGAKNFNKLINSWAYIRHPFCWGVMDSIRPMKTLCETISSQAYTKPGVFAGLRMCSAWQKAIKTFANKETKN